MANPVPQAASPFGLAAVRTGQPVSTPSLSRLSDELAHVNGYLLHKSGEALILPRPAARTQLPGLAHTVHAPWTRSAGAQVVRVTVELHDSEDIGDSQTIAVTLPTGASWIDDGGLDGATVLYNLPRGRTVPREIVGWCDVSGVTVGTLTDTFVFGVTPTSKGAGVKRATITEVPLAALAISATEPGWDAAAVRAGRLVIDGGSSSPRGTQRLWYLLDQGRANYRQHLTLSGLESADTTGTGTTPHWSRESSSEGDIDWLSTNGSDPAFYLQLRDLYAGDPSVWAFRARYRTSNGTACELKVYHQGGGLSGGAWSGAGAEGSTALTLPGTSGAWAWATAVAVSLPVDGADGLVRIRFQAKGPGAAQLLSLACLDLRENET